jgi:tetratricopeptide (TPR) repeat protein
MPTLDEIDQQQELLRDHRQTLAILLQQQDTQDGKVYVQLEAAKAIQDAREGISKCKATLREWNVAIEDLPDDALTRATSSMQWAAVWRIVATCLRECQNTIVGGLTVAAVLTTVYLFSAYALDADAWIFGIGVVMSLLVGLIYLIPRCIFWRNYRNQEESRRSRRHLWVLGILYALSILLTVWVGGYLRDQTQLPGTVLPAVMRRRDTEIYVGSTLAVLWLLCIIIASTQVKPRNHNGSTAWRWISRVSRRWISRVSRRWISRVSRGRDHNRISGTQPNDSHSANDRVSDVVQAMPMAMPRAPWRFAPLRSGALIIIYILPLLVSGWAGYYLWQPSSKVIIVLTEFGGTEEQKYHVTDAVLAHLRTLRDPYSDVEVKVLKQPITEAQGSQVARDVGKKYKAAMVIWGSYSETSTTTSVSVNLEILCPLKCQPNLGGWHAPDLEGLQTFKLQTDLSAEMSYLWPFIIGVIRFDAEDWSVAIKVFTDALNQAKIENPALDVIGIYRFRTIAYINTGQYDLARADLKEILKINPHATWVYRDLSSLDIIQNNYLGARENNDHAMRSDPSNPENYTNRGLINFYSGEYVQAIYDYTRALELDKTSAEAYNGRADVYEWQGKHDMAIADYSEAIRLNKKFVKAYVGRASSYEALKRYKDAIEDYTQALSILPDTASFYVRRAVDHSQVGDDDNALSDLNTAIELDDKYAGAYSNRGVLYANRNEISAAMNDLNHAIDLDNGQADFYDNRGTLYMRLENYPRALNEFNEAIRLKPYKAEYYFHRSYAYAFNGETDNEIADLKKVLTLNPDSDLQNQAEERLKELELK